MNHPHTSVSLGRPSTLMVAAVAVAVGVVPIAAAPIAAAPAGAASAARAGAGPRDIADLVPLTDCVSDDNGAPVIKRLTMNRRVVDVRRHARTWRVTIAAKDTGGPGAASGTVGGGVSIETALGRRDGPTAERPLKPAPDGTWKATFRFPRRIGTESWYLGVRLDDAAGNSAYYPPNKIPDLGFPDAMRVRSQPRQSWGFTTLRYGAGPLHLGTKPGQMQVTARLSGTLPVSRILLRAGDTNGHHATAVLRRAPGAARTFKGAWTIPAQQGTATWHPRSATVIITLPSEWWDFSGKQLRRAEVRHGFRVIGPRDSSQPRVTGYDVSPTQVDATTSNQTITPTVTATDIGAGVSRVTVRMHPRNLYGISARAELHRTAGTPANGTWTGSLVFKPCKTTAGPWVTDVTVWDAAGNRRPTLHPRDLTAQGWPALVHVLGPDHTLPAVNFSSPDGVVATVTFDDDVTGIDTDSAIIYRGPYQISDTDWSDPGPPAEGTWSCQDATATVTDCATGLVRTATFTATKVGDWDTLMLNPEHVLAVRDTAGNPYDHTTFGIHWLSSSKAPGTPSTGTWRSTAPAASG